MKFLTRNGGIVLLLFFCWLPAAVAQSGLEKVSSVIVTNIGPKVASDELVRANIHVKTGDVYVRSSIDRDVLNLYATGLFSNIRVTDRHAADGVVLTYILEGKLRLTGITIEGNTKFSTAKLTKKLTSKIGDPLDERKLFTDCETIQKMYEKAGYQHTTVKYVEGNFDYETGRASVTFQILETPKVKIVEVDFIGAHAFKLSKLRRVVKTRRHWMFSWLTRKGVFKEDQFAEDKQTLTDFYQNAGYIDFEIKDVKFVYPTPRTLRVEFIISEGVQYKVGSVTFKGNKLFTTEQIVEGLKKQHSDNRSKTKIGVDGLEADVNMTFKPDALEHDTHSVEDFYGSRGYINQDGPNGFRLGVNKIPNTETGTMDLEYNVDEGQKAYIEKILIKGNVKTKDKVIRRELAVSPGDVFNMVLVRRSKERLEGLNYFDKVDTKPEPLPDVPNHDDLIIGVDEKSTGNFTFGAGFNTVESIFGYAEVSQANFDLFNPPYFTGGGQKFRLRVTLGTELQDYLISFEEPWFLNKKLRLGIDLYRSVVDYVSLDNLYNLARTGAKFTLTRALGSENFIGSVGYNIEDVGVLDVSTNAPTTIMRESGDSLVSRFSTSLAYDTRNSYELPNKGQRTEIASTLSVGDREYYKVELKTTWFFKSPIVPTHTIQLLARAGVTQQLSGPDVPFYDRFYLGGPDDLRGFDYTGVGPREVSQDGTLYEPIGGDTYWFASAEYTIPIIDRLSLAFFYDIGHVSAKPFSNEGDIVQASPFAPLNGSRQIPFNTSNYGPYSAGSTDSFSDDFGIGLRLTIPTLGPLRLDYGIPIHHDAFNGPGGKFQFGAGFSRPL